MCESIPFIISCTPHTCRSLPPHLPPAAHCWPPREESSRSETCWTQKRPFAHIYVTSLKSNARSSLPAFCHSAWPFLLGCIFRGKTEVQGCERAPVQESSICFLRLWDNGQTGLNGCLKLTYISVLHVLPLIKDWDHSRNTVGLELD